MLCERGSKPRTYGTTMHEIFKTMTVLAALSLAHPAMAQETQAAGSEDEAQTEAQTGQGDEEGEGGLVPPNDLSMGRPVNGGDEAGATYIAEEFEAWEMRCVRTEEGDDPCQLYQLLKDENGNSVAEISVFGLPEAQQQQAVAGATIITPLGTLLTRQLTLSVDSGQAKRYPFTFCATAGCFSRIGLGSADINAFKRGVTAVLTVVPVAAPDQQIELDISLAGFTDGYEAVVATNAGQNTQE